MIDVGRYLDRIGVDRHTGAPGLDLLAALQLAHLVSVPFENLHVFHGRGVRTDVEWSYPKIVERRRGGWCFEVNGAFSALLEALGFHVDRVQCQVWDAGEGRWGPVFDHLALVVHLDGARWLVDVGFGDNCVHPLLLESGERDATPRRARLEVDDEGFTLTELVPADSLPEAPGTASWEPQARGTFMPRRLPDFDGRSHALQAGSLFSEKPFATRALDGLGSRITLRREVLRRRDAEGRVEDRRVEVEEWSGLLAEHFGLDDARERAGQQDLR